MSLHMINKPGAIHDLNAHNRQRGAPTARLSTAVRAALLFFFALLKKGIPSRVFAFRKRRKRRIIIWSDAMYDGGALGIVACIESTEDGVTSREWLYTHASCDERFMQRFVHRKTYIGQLELLAAVAAYYSLPDIVRGESVMHYVDNSSAVAALVKGYSQQPDSVHILHAMWALVASLACAPWFKFVRSKANVADLPSRGQLEFITNVLKARKVPFIMPPFEMWASIEQALAAIDSCQPKAPVHAAAPSRKRARSKRA